MTMDGLMQGKRGLIMGLANDKSLAWGIAKSLAEHGAELAFSYQGEALGKRVKPLAEQLGSDFTFECDVGDMDALDAGFAQLRQRWDRLDFLVHAIGFSDKNELRGKYVDTSLDNFLTTMNISAYSLVAVTKRARAMMTSGGSVLTLTYYGAEKVVPHYNVMGVAKAALEASVRYLANDLGPGGHPRERAVGRADQDPRGQRHRRFPLYPQMERTECAPAPQHQHRGRRRCRALFAVRPGLGGDGGSPPRRCGDTTRSA